MTANIAIVSSQVSILIAVAEKSIEDFAAETIGTSQSVLTYSNTKPVISSTSSLQFAVADGVQYAKSYQADTTGVTVRSNSNLALPVTISSVSIPTTINWEANISVLDLLGPNATISFGAPRTQAYIPVSSGEIYDFLYDTPGTYSWVCPANVYLVSVVCVGGGGGGGRTWSSGGGGGGGLGWKNNIPVVPGQSYTVVAGAGGLTQSNATSAAAAGGNSYFISLTTVAGYGGGQGGPGSTGSTGGYGGGFFGDGGGRGGNGAYDGSWTRGGAGAGGYTGAGADSGNSTGTAAPPGGGGGAPGYYSSTYGVPAGGGVGLYGQGASGAATGNTGSGGKGGSGGQDGSPGESSGSNGGVNAGGNDLIKGGDYGGGGGGSGTSYGGGPGGKGAVRIICKAGTYKTLTITANGYSSTVAIAS